VETSGPPVFAEGLGEVAETRVFSFLKKQPRKRDKNISNRHKKFPEATKRIPL
jgi:hypothetical protein